MPYPIFFLKKILSANKWQWVMKAQRENNRYSRDRKKNREEKGSATGFRKRRLRAEGDGNYKNHFKKKSQEINEFYTWRCRHQEMSMSRTEQSSARRFQIYQTPVSFLPIPRETAILKYHFY